MATVKKLNTSYTLDTKDVYLTGNLHVAGTYETTDVKELEVVDKNIILNVGETGNGVSTGSKTSGLIIDRGTAANVELHWDENFQRWRITTDGTNYANVVASSTSDTFLQEVVDDATPKLGGNLDVQGYTIYSSNVAVPNIKFEGNLQLTNVFATPSLASNATVVYGNTPGGGTSGIYVVNEVAVNQELITKTRAFGFSLIL